MKKLATAAVASAALALSAAPASAQTGTMLQADLAGTKQVGPGDSDGLGGFIAMAYPDIGYFCYSMTSVAIETPTAAHVHMGMANENGGVAIPLDPPIDGSSSGCVEAEETMLNSIIANPMNYYVNVHNATYPNGAIRGQLMK